MNMNFSLITHTNDNVLYFYNPEPTIIRFLQRVAPDPQMTLYHSRSYPISNTFLPTDDLDVLDFDCDKIEPVNTEPTNRFVCLFLLYISKEKNIFIF